MLTPRLQLQNFRDAPLHALAPRKGRSKFPRALPGVPQELIVVVTVIAVVIVIAVVTGFSFGFNFLALIAKDSRWDFLSSLLPTWPTPILSLLVDLSFLVAIATLGAVGSLAALCKIVTGLPRSCVISHSDGLMVINAKPSFAVVGVISEVIQA